MKKAPITIAVPKGRVLSAWAEFLSAAGIETSGMLSSSRKLVRDVDAGNFGKLRILLLKPDDVPTYVEYGVADLGIVGRDVLFERDDALYVPLDLNIGRCRMVMAGPRKESLNVAQRPLRVATKFHKTATRYFKQQGRPVQIISVHSSVELAPLMGLSDVIVDLVETGETLKANGLIELETIESISTVVIANRVGLKLKSQVLRPFLKALAGQSLPLRSNESRH